MDTQRLLKVADAEYWDRTSVSKNGFEVSRYSRRLQAQFNPDGSLEFGVTWTDSHGDGSRTTDMDDLVAFLMDPGEGRWIGDEYIDDRFEAERKDTRANALLSGSSAQLPAPGEPWDEPDFEEPLL